MAHAIPGFIRRRATRRTEQTTSFEVPHLLLRAGTTVVAKAAFFPDHLWRPRLEPLANLAHIRVVERVVDDQIADFW